MKRLYLFNGNDIVRLKPGSNLYFNILIYVSVIYDTALFCGSWEAGLESRINLFIYLETEYLVERFLSSIYLLCFSPWAMFVDNFCGASTTTGRRLLSSIQIPNASLAVE